MPTLPGLNGNRHGADRGRGQMRPPLRSAAESGDLWQKVLAGDFDLIASDHSPAPPSMKQSDDFFDVWGGISGVQSTFSLLLSLEPRMPLEQVAALTSGNAATRFRLPNKGQISEGFDADLALVDLDAIFILRRERLLDRHKFSPYVGRKMRGEIRHRSCAARQYTATEISLPPPTADLSPSRTPMQIR